ncbi:MCE family protein [Mycolicibacterium sp. CBMA 226]|uniref:MCE family protein n=1 Tax=Mycolicibacterium sp. CBMA 226 TaxID=2606611 RepID=UPI0012DE1C0F|nr:MCE family protein [Mycolicibacterium sp. CBMA 226]MUL78717.1 MCE family protein [Mycolicibacterium sp. CBMA 226]
MKRNLIIATAAVAAIALAVAVFVIPRTKPQPITVTAQFEDAIGLYVGNSVSVLGMPVGSVASITPKSTYIEVKLVINPGVTIPADATAVTVSTSILTDRHIELTPPYKGGAKLGNGDILGLGRTRTPVEFDRTLSMVDKLVSALRGDGKGNGPVADLLNVGDQITSANGTRIKETLDKLAAALKLGDDHGDRSKKNIQAIAAGLATLTQEAADNDTTIRNFGSNVRQISDILADENLGTGRTGTQINEILTRTATLLEKNRDNLKVTTGDFRIITQSLIDYQREVAEFFDIAPMTIDNLSNVIDYNAPGIRVHALTDKLMTQSQFGKEICNLIGAKQLGCATGTIRDYGPDFGLNGMFELMAGEPHAAP